MSNNNINNQEDILDNITDEEYSSSESIDEASVSGIYNSEFPDEPDIKEHKFSLVDSLFEFAVLVAGVLYTAWNLVDLIQVILNHDGLSAIITSTFDVIVKAIPFIILLVALECHEKLSIIEENLSITTDYISDYNNHFDEQLVNIQRSVNRRNPKGNKGNNPKQTKNNNKEQN